MDSFFETENNNYKPIDDVFKTYFLLIEKEIADGVKRIDTLRSYKSFHKVFISFLNKKHSLKLLVEIDTQVLNTFLDYIYLERKVSPITYNNYLQFLSTFFLGVYKKDIYLKTPLKTSKTNQNLLKKRTVLTPEVKKHLKNYGKENKEYYILCMCIYYAFIRKTEITKIKVEDVNLKLGFITVLGENAKNKKTENVTIPNSLQPYLVRHLKNAKLTDYLFSHDNFKVGPQKLKPKKISDQWAKFRKQYNIPLQYQFYSLKDTGITDLLNSGIPAIKVRDQARHHDLKITESYTQRNETFDAIVKNADFVF